MNPRKRELDYYLKNVEDAVKFSDIEDFDNFEERFFEIEGCYGCLVGMGLDFVEFCPENSPPLLDKELLPWIWLIHPNLCDEICVMADQKLREMICAYNEEKNPPKETLSDILDMKNKDIDDLLENFVQHAISFHQFTKEANWRKGNATIKKIFKVHALIKKQGVEAQQKLLALIHSDLPAVASQAASCSMRFSPDECLAVFEKLAKQNIPFISMDAEYAIKNWHNNNWWDKD